MDDSGGFLLGIWVGLREPSFWGLNSSEMRELDSGELTDVSCGADLSKKAEGELEASGIKIEVSLFSRGW